MNRWQFYTTVCLAGACVVLSTAGVGVAYRNQKFQKQLQARQAQLNSSVLSPQAQQIARNVIQEMASIAATNNGMRDLLTKHGYTLQQDASETPVGDVEIEATSEDE